MGESGLIGHGSSLRKSGNKYSFTGYAALSLIVNEPAQGIRGDLQLNGINLAVNLHFQNIIPGGHDKAAVNGNGNGWCVRKDKTNR